MKKIIVLLLAISLLVLSCTDSGSGSTSEAEPKTKFHVTYTGIKSGSNPVDTNEYSSGDTVTLAAGDGSFCSSGGDHSLTFMGWKDENNTYKAGSTYIITGDVTFTADYNDVTCDYGCSNGVCKIPGCDSDAHCAGNADGKTKCDTASHTCVAP